MFVSTTDSVRYLCACTGMKPEVGLDNVKQVIWVGFNFQMASKW